MQLRNSCYRSFQKLHTESKFVIQPEWARQPNTMKTKMTYCSFGLVLTMQ
jgi:hypothetical protein